MEHKILPPYGNSSINFPDESSRKRKLTADDERGNVSEIGSGYGFSKTSNLLHKILDGKTLTVSNGPPQAYNLFSEAEQLILPILEFSGGRQAGKAEVDPGLQGYKNHVVGENESMKVCYSSSEILRPSELLHQSSVDNHELPGVLEGKACMPETRKYRPSVLKKIDPNLNTVGSSAAIASLGLCPHIEHTQIDRKLQNDAPAGGGTEGEGLSDILREDDQGHTDSSIQIKKKTKGSHEISSKSGGKPTDVVVGNDWRSDNSHSSSKLSEEKSISLARKLATTIAEKLWDGSLQLNSSVTVSAVAFFKSGEKMPDVKWSELVEVKGKVRLEAFEKYIQDLSRSRSRGLMVISLCWKEGSSKSGLVGMKKVAKGYKEGKRVGFVQLSPGIDLYVCPRSDTIITILAKHGFLKGMAAVVDNQDTLIGCVMWRRNGASTNSATKKSDRKDCPSSSIHENQRFVGKDLSCTEPSQESVPVASETESTTLERAGNNINKGKHLKGREVQHEWKNSSASASLSLTSSVLRPQTFSCSNSAIDLASIQGLRSRLTEAETAPIHKSSIQRSEQSLALQKPLSCFAFDVTKQPTPTLDDDDLPEYDFGTACGISHQMRKSLDVVTVDKTLAEGLRKMDGSLQPSIQTVQSPSAFTLRLPRLSLDAIQRMPSLKKVYVCEEKTIQSRGIMTPVTAAASKNRFNDAAAAGDDDDDMPEWCPPNVKLHKQLVPPTTLASTTLVPSEVPNSTFERFSTSYPYPLPVGYAPSTQATPHANRCSIDVTMKLVQPNSRDRFIQRGPSSSLLFNANPPLRLPPNAFDIEQPFRPAGWRGWRP